ncbi:hypothetical protein Hanom_Chr03g00215201 [Helianthus anomalus]
MCNRKTYCHNSSLEEMLHHIFFCLKYLGLKRERILQDLGHC